MTTERPSHEALEAWIKRSWDHRPPFTYEVLVEMWQAEQASRAKARETDWREKKLDELGRRVTALERILGPGGKRLIEDIATGVGAALGKSRAQERGRILGEVEARGYVSYRGTWDEGVGYEKGAMVSCGGAGWISVAPVEKGARPGRAAEWRLAVKGDGARPPVVA